MAVLVTAIFFVQFFGGKCGGGVSPPDCVGKRFFTLFRRAVEGLTRKMTGTR